MPSPFTSTAVTDDDDGPAAKCWPRRMPPVPSASSTATSPKRLPVHVDEVELAVPVHIRRRDGSSELGPAAKVGGRAESAGASAQQHRNATKRVRDDEVELAVPIQIRRRNRLGQPPTG